MAVSLSLASEALTAAFCAALPELGYDHPTCTAIRDAQDATKRARSEAIDWEERR